MIFPRFKAINTLNYIQNLSDNEAPLPESEILSLKKICDLKKEKSLTFFDLETSGLSPFVHEIIEIAAIQYQHKTNSFRKFSTLVKPEHQLTEQNIAIHKITNKMLESAPEKESVLKSFADFIDSSSLIAYNSQFDIGFLLAEHYKNEEYFPVKAKLVYDCLPLARYVHKFKENKPENFKLSTLNSYYDLKLNSHRAYDDSIACLRVFCKSLEVLQNLKKIEKFQVFDFKTSLKFKKTPKIEKILKAISQSQKIKIIYKGGSKGREPRPLEPIAILPLPSGVFLYSKCLKDDLNKAFNLKKVQEVLCEN